MKRWILILCAASSLYAQENKDQTQKNQSPSMEQYQAKDFSYLIGIPGFSEKTLNMHFKLYEGYVNNTNKFLKILQDYAQEGQTSTPQFQEIKRRLGFEFDGMRLHELYFSNLGGKGTELNPDSPLYQRMVQDFGSFEAWKKDFVATGELKGVGWAVLYLDPVRGRLINTWIGEHQVNHLAGGQPILIMDVWEHAYLLDYGLDRKGYIQAFFENIDWNIVDSRFPDAEKKSRRN